MSVFENHLGVKLLFKGRNHTNELWIEETGCVSANEGRVAPWLHG